MTAHIRPVRQCNINRDFKHIVEFDKIPKSEKECRSLEVQLNESIQQLKALDQKFNQELNRAEEEIKYSSAEKESIKIKQIKDLKKLKRKERRTLNTDNRKSLVTKIACLKRKISDMVTIPEAVVEYEKQQPESPAQKRRRISKETKNFEEFNNLLNFTC